MQSTENSVLAQALGAIGGFGARLVARFLPSVSFECAFEVTGAPAAIAARAARLLADVGKPILKFPSRPQEGVFFALLNGGVYQLNPTIVQVTVTAKGNGSSVHIRAVAKEGLVEQKTAQGIATALHRALAGAGS